jgi:hypothetical protein
MDARALYRLTAPTEWAGSPPRFSFSSLKRMSVCLRHWQLARSRYEDLSAYPERPSEAAEVGSIVHDLLSPLFRATALAGYPALGSTAFQEAVTRVDILGTARTALAAFEERALASPRRLGFRRRATARDVYNKVAAAFRDEYARVVAQAFAPIPLLEEATASHATKKPAETLALLERLGVLSEEEVHHPTPPLWGFVDLLVRRDGRTTVLDFKTGASRPEYRDQLLLYALMWWRSTGDMPAGIELRYGARVEAWPVVKEELLRVEKELDVKIARFAEGLAAQPAAATVGPHCVGCSVRQLCGDYWMLVGEQGGATRAGEQGDLEVLVQSTATKTGFVGKTTSGREMTVVFEEDVGAFSGPFIVGKRLRVLGATRDPEEGTVRLTRTAEVFHGA